jgi:hypothetical protein
VALVMSLAKGQDFFVGDDCFVVDEVHDATSFTVRQLSTGRQWCVQDSRSWEVLPDVFLSAGESRQAMHARVVVDAPRSIQVLRGERYRNPPQAIQAHLESNP